MKGQQRSSVKQFHQVLSDVAAWLVEQAICSSTNLPSGLNYKCDFLRHFLKIKLILH